MTSSAWLATSIPGRGTCFRPPRSRSAGRTGAGAPGGTSTSRGSRRSCRRGTLRDRRAEIPDGLVDARAQLMRLLDELEARFAVTADRLVLGGFSQGAMLSLDVALHRATPPAGLLLMSGTLIAEAAWAPRMPSLEHVPVMLSHGRHDPLLPFAIAELLREQLTAAGAKVDWHPFAGGHEIPATVLTAAVGFLRARAGA